VAAALEAVAAQRHFEDVEDVPERLRRFVVRGSADKGIVGVSEAAERLEVSRTTVYEWARTNKLIAWKTTKRGLRIPAGQILGAGRIVPGLNDVVDAIGDSELGVGVRGDGRAAARTAQGRPHRRSAGRGTRFRRHVHMTGGRYRGNRIAPVLVTAPLPRSYRIMVRRHRADPLGTFQRPTPV